MSTIISEKYHNYDYAPGIPTYGIDGKNGKSGMNGMSVFVCQYDNTTDSGVASFGDAILQTLDMSLSSNTKINREYIEGDSFLFSNCDIWKIVDIIGLKSAAAINQLTTANFSEYMEKVGQINMTTTTDGLTENGNRLALDTAQYKGFVINTANMSNDEISDINAPFTILSNKTDNNDAIQFIDFKSIYSNATDSELKIYYDTNTKAYHLYSDRPILFDCDLKVSNTTSDEFDEYSSILTKDNGITEFVSMCNGRGANNITYAVEITEGDSVESISAHDIDDGGMEEKNEEGMTEDEVRPTFTVKFSFNNIDIDNYPKFNETMFHIQGVMNHKVGLELFIPFTQCVQDSYDYDIRSYEYETDNEDVNEYDWKISLINNVEVYIERNPNV